MKNFNLAGNILLPAFFLLMIYTIGETVLDIIFKNKIAQTSKAGGSALNTAVSLARLGTDVNFISEIGNDTTGNNILSFLEENNVGTHNIYKYNSHKTSLALAFLNENNDATYEFYKDLPAQVEPQQIVFELHDILLYSSSYALQERTRNMFLLLMKKAEESGIIRMYDPNMRKSLQLDSLEFKFLKENVGFAQIVRASDEDCANIFNETNGAKVYKILQDLGVGILVLTKNKHAVEVFTPHFVKKYKVEPIKTVSTIGAGDTFNAGLLHCFSINKINSINIELQNEQFWDNAITFAIQCSAEVCQSYDNYVSVKE